MKCRQISNNLDFSMAGGGEFINLRLTNLPSKIASIKESGGLIINGDELEVNFSLTMTRGEEEEE